MIKRRATWITRKYAYPLASELKIIGLWFPSDWVAKEINFQELCNYVFNFLLFLNLFKLK